MSTPPRTRVPQATPAPPAQPTRQLLDELDALMQRMLDLPVNQLEEELNTPAREAAPNATAEALPGDRPTQEAMPLGDAPAERETLVRLDPPSELPGPESEIPRAPSLWLTPTISEAEDRATGDPWEEDAKGGGASFRRSAPKSIPEKTEEEWERSLPVSPEVLEALGAPKHRDKGGDRPGQRAGTQVMAPLPYPVGYSLPPAWLQPLVWSNRAFDACTSRLGPLGRWLRSSQGRAILGWVGLGLLAGAVGWLVVNELGWTP